MFITCNLCTRALSIIMYLYLYARDRHARSKDRPKSKQPNYAQEALQSHVIKSVASLLFSVGCLAVTLWSEYSQKAADETDGRSSSLDDDYDPANLATDDQIRHGITCGLWILSALIEQFGLISSCIYGSLPFCAEYAGDRMKIWLMLCFGESIIGKHSCSRNYLWFSYIKVYNSTHIESCPRQDFCIMLYILTKHP